MIEQHAISFKNAFRGLMWVLRTQRNIKIHLFLSFLSMVGGAYFRIGYGEFLVILTLIATGLSIEVINTAIEETIDALDKNQREEIRIAKDVSAAAMLMFSVVAFCIACIIFIPRILFFIFHFSFFI